MSEALELAQQQELDLVEVAGNADPPVCRIMDYGKFRYMEAQRAKESRRQSAQVVVKEIKFRPKIGKGDYNTKVRKMESFLEEGNRVKVTIMFRGREVQYPEQGRRILDQVAEDTAEIARVETFPKMDGRNLVMVLVPEKKSSASSLK